MSINKFYYGYLATMLAILALCALKFTFIEVMAIVGTAITGTALVFAAGWLMYRTYIYFYGGGGGS